MSNNTLTYFGTIKEWTGTPQQWAKHGGVITAWCNGKTILKLCELFQHRSDDEIVNVWKVYPVPIFNIDSEYMIQANNPNKGEVWAVGSYSSEMGVALGPELSESLCKEGETHSYCIGMTSGELQVLEGDFAVFKAATVEEYYDILD